MDSREPFPQPAREPFEDDPDVGFGDEVPSIAARGMVEKS
jgi:hypothetical protein